MKKKILLFILTITIIASIFPVSLMTVNAEEITSSGTCSENLTWTLDSSGTLTISGTGEMDTYISSSYQPWYSVNSNITTVEIENGVTSIGANAFYGCTNLTNITIPSSVRNIWGKAFYNCTSLSSITIPSSVINIGDNIFYNCTSLTSITIPSSIASIGNFAFCGCTNLTSVTIPSSVTYIGNFAFSGCSSLTDVYYDGTEEEWNSINLKTENSNLTNATMHFAITSGTCGKNLTWTLDDAGILTISGTGEMDTYSSSSYQPWYSVNSNITTVEIENGVTSIGANAFYGCTNLTNITIPNSVTSIGEDAFSSCYDLTSVTIPGSVKTIGVYAFFNCEKLYNVNIEEGVEYIGRSAFQMGAWERNIYVPRSITYIGKDAFFECCANVYYAGSEKEWENLGYCDSIDDYADSPEEERWYITDIYCTNSTCYIECSETANGKIKYPSYVESGNYGDITIIPEIGYYIESFTVNGKNNLSMISDVYRPSVVSLYITKDTPIAATFAPIETTADITTTDVVTIPAIFAGFVDNIPTAITFGKVVNDTNIEEYGIMFKKADGTEIKVSGGAGPHFKANIKNSSGQYAIEFKGLEKGSYIAKTYVKYIGESTPRYGYAMNFTIE